MNKPTPPLHTKPDWFDFVWDHIESGTRWLMDVVDEQPWTHVALAVALWFTISYIKSINLFFITAWIPWAWYICVIVGSPWRTGYR